MSGKYIALPKGVTEKDLDAAIGEFRRVLGPEQVFTDAGHLAPYMKIMLAVPEAQHAPSAAICPRSVEQIQQVVKICNKHRVPIWPISTGRNLGYGSAAPATPGQIVMDLRLMNRILHVDPELCTALVEPGVTYQQLYDYIEQRNLPVWLSCPAPSAIAGPLGNTVDRGVGYTPYGEHFLFSCGMEVVLPNAEVLRTGMGAVSNSNTWQVFKWGYGPYLDGIFTQSNFGIVTKLGLWLMPRPPAYKPFVIRYEKESDIVGIVDTLRPLRIAAVIPNAVVIVNTLWDAAPVTKRADFYSGKGQIPDSAVREIMAAKKLGAWNVYAALYGTPEQVEVNWKIVTQAVAASRNGDILTAAEVNDSPVFKYRAELMAGKMTLQEFSLYNWRGGGGSMWFSPVSQAKGSETLQQMALAKSILEKHGFDYVAEFIVGWRDMHHIIDLLFDRSDPAQMTAAHRCYSELIDEFAKRGYGVYRTNTAFMDKVAGIYGPVMRDVNRKLKKALDPNGILAPGKSGIAI